jgi:hypothetical protein
VLESGSGPGGPEVQILSPRQILKDLSEFTAPSQLRLPPTSLEGGFFTKLDLGRQPVLPRLAKASDADDTLSGCSQRISVNRFLLGMAEG